MSADENSSTEDQYNSNQKNSDSKHLEESISFQEDQCPKTSINMAKNEEEQIIRKIGLVQENSSSKIKEISNELKALGTEDKEDKKMQTDNRYELDEESEGDEKMFRLLSNKRKRGEI